MAAGTQWYARAARWGQARPAAVLVPAAVLSGALAGALSPDGDGHWFRQAGLVILGPQLFDVFGESGLQVGPVLLLGLGLVVGLGEILGLPAAFAAGAASGGGLVAYALYLTRRFARDLGADERTAQWGVGGTVLLAGPLAEAVVSGHVEEVFGGLVLAHALLAVRGGHPGRVGALIGLAAGLKLWGLLGAPLVLVRGRPSGVVRAGVVTIAVVATCYLPFRLLGEMNTFEFDWGRSIAPFGLPLPQLEFGGWGLRVVQALGVVLIAGAVARFWPGTGFGTLLAVLTAKVVLDPVLQTYYVLPAVVIALMWLWTTSGVAPRTRGTAALGVALALVGTYLVPYEVRYVSTHIALTAITAAVVRHERRTLQQQPARAPSTPLGR